MGYLLALEGDMEDKSSCQVACFFFFWEGEGGMLGVIRRHMAGEEQGLL